MEPRIAKEIIELQKARSTIPSAPFPYFRTRPSGDKDDLGREKSLSMTPSDSNLILLGVVHFGFAGGTEENCPRRRFFINFSRDFDFDIAVEDGTITPVRVPSGS